MKEEGDPLAEMMKLFDTLVGVMEKSRKIRRENVPSKLFFEIYNMWSNTKSKTFNESAVWVSPEIANSLLEQGFVQKIVSEEGEKYALTCTGIVQCIRMKYGKQLDEQFADFLALVDQKFDAVEQTSLNWNEKLATLCLILLASASPSSAIRLNNETNKRVLAEVFQKTLSCLKTNGIIRRGEELRKVNRGESIASALMSRLDGLARKTNHYYTYIGKGSEYFLDVEKNGSVDEKRLCFLLGRVFGHFNPNCDYKQLNKELEEIGQLYYPRFLSRSLNPTVVLGISQILRNFMNDGILRLPLEAENGLKQIEQSQT